MINDHGGILLLSKPPKSLTMSRTMLKAISFKAPPHRSCPKA
jgi:hypothetical protein